MIWVTGDTHGEWMRRLNGRKFPEGKKMKKDDYVIICGDFGLWKDGKQERYALDWLDERNFTTLFVCGNHENFDRLYDLPVEEWKGGKVHFIRPSVIHLMRGQIFLLQETKFFTFGGASSHDVEDGILEPDDSRIKLWSRGRYTKNFRVNHESWWRQELPSEEEMQEGIENLKKHNNKVDIVITHCGFTSLLSQLEDESYSSDILTDYFDLLREKMEYKKWFFGHYHGDRMMGEKEYMIYEKRIQIV